MKKEVKKETIKKTSSLIEMVDNLEKKLDEFFTTKVWQLPKKVREVLVKIAPYLAILSLVATIPAVLALLGFSMLTPFYFMKGIHFGLAYSLSLIFLLVGAILAVIIIPGLFKREKRVWKIMFWMSLINAVGAILKMDLGGLIIGTGLSWYVLFQVKEYYKK
jgi:hypothetical protein